MSDPSKERTRADAQFKKAERATEGAQAMSEYDAERQAERAKTARLKELRLAKEAADKEAEPVAKKQKAPAGTSAGPRRDESVVRNVKTQDKSPKPHR